MPSKLVYVLYPTPLRQYPSGDKGKAVAVSGKLQLQPDSQQEDKIRVASTLFDVEEMPVVSEKSNEWYTPALYIEAARDVMSGIDLDPASCDIANKVVKAKRYYTKESDGLQQDWSADSIWLNPPYARTILMQAYRQSLIGLFMQKLQDTYMAGLAKQAIALVTTEVNARWFIPLWNYPICFPDHRIHFIVPHKRPHGDYKQMFGSCFVYFGPNEEKFTGIFSQFGRIIKAIDTPKQPLPQPTLWDQEAS